MIRRRLLTFLSALSLILCVGTAVLWVRSELVEDTLDLESVHWQADQAVYDRRWRMVGWVGGELYVLFGRSHESATAIHVEEQAYPEGTHLNYDRSTVHDFEAAVGDFNHSSWHGFYLQRFADPTGYGVEAAAPAWTIILLLLIPPAMSVRKWSLRRQAMRHGCCEHCGYDLRATPEKCPECGQPVPQKAEASA